MRVFMTGGSGYIGRSTVQALVRHGIEVTALARSADAARVVSELGAAPVRGALTDLAVLREEAGRADGVIHLGQSYTPDTAAVDLAAAGALQDGAGERPYVHTGGVWIFGDTDGVVGETAPYQPPRLTAWRLPNEEAVLSRVSSGGRPVVVMPGVVYGHAGGLAQACFAEPGRAAGAVAYIGDGRNHWALVHVEDIAELYVLALDAKPGAKYLGVSDQNPPLADIAAALSHSVGCAGRTVSVTLDQARAQMGLIAEAFALDQRLTGLRARAELGWAPRHLDALSELARPS